MVTNKQKRIEIRGLSDQDIDYLKALAVQKNYTSFNSFLVAMCREKIESGQFNKAGNLYLSALENMKETGRQIASFEDSMSEYANHISRWLEYEGMVDNEL